MAKAIRCRHEKVHAPKGGAGNILFVFEGDSIYAKCTDRGCKCWSKVKIVFPGVSHDFEKAGITQEVMPKDFKFKVKNGDIDRAVVVIKGDS